MRGTKIAYDGTFYYKNPFPDLVKNEWLTLGMFIRMLFGGLPYSKLPDDVASAVDGEMERRIRMPRT
jgi:hypothetical protein